MKDRKIAVIGLGYVGLPLAVAFAEKRIPVIGFDTDREKIQKYRLGIDPSEVVGSHVVADPDIHFTSDEADLKGADFFIIAVPTPTNKDHTPDLSCVIKASAIVGRNMPKGSMVVYESTVYPGCTEDVCIPVLEQSSGMTWGTDFKVGYSPERINPGDREHGFKNVCKIIAGSDEDALKQMRNVYEQIVEAGTWSASNIKTAEAIKVIENSQRDINIAFINEVAKVFHELGIDTNEVVDGMNTKWNALGFRPGLVGGHCIGVDPYYFTYGSEKLGIHSRLIIDGRMINESMAEYVADAAVREMILAEQTPAKATVVILGVTFKENCSDIRNTKVADLVRRLNSYGIDPVVIDPRANPSEVMREYGIRLVSMEESNGADCIIVAVAHDEFKESGQDNIMGLYRNTHDEKKVLIDVKGIFDPKELKDSEIRYWRL